VSLARHLRAFVTATVLLAALAVPGAPAAQSRPFALTVSITGQGSVLLSTGRHVTCTTSCRRTVLVRAGSRVTLSTQPGMGWKFGAWSGACRGTATACKVRMNRAVRVGVTFIAPGARENPFPLGQAVEVRDNWQVKVISATLDATEQVRAFAQQKGYYWFPPSPGAQFMLVNFSATYLGGGSTNFGPLMFSLKAMGAHNAGYGVDDECASPLPDLRYARDDDTFSGQTVTGNLCFGIASNDADSLLLSVPVGETALGSLTYLWFALR
jgi:hypothetical protein